MAWWRVVQKQLSLCRNTFSGYAPCCIKVSAAYLTVCLPSCIHFTADSEDKVEPLDPSPECKPGDRVFVAGYETTRGTYSVKSIVRYRTLASCMYACNYWDAQSNVPWWSAVWPLVHV